MSRNQTDRQRRTDEVLYFLEDHVAPNIIYYGRTDTFSGVKSDDIWQIKRVVRVGTEVEILYANNGKYNCVWDDRSAYFPAEPSHANPSVNMQVSLFDEEGNPFTNLNKLPVTASFSGLTLGGLITSVVLNDVTWTALPLAALANRNAMSIQNVSAIAIKINYDNATVGYVGVTIAPGSERAYDISDTITIYAKSASGTPTIQIEELA